MHNGSGEQRTIFGTPLKRLRARTTTSILRQKTIHPFGKGAINRYYQGQLEACAVPTQSHCEATKWQKQSLGQRREIASPLRASQ